uniref:Nam-like protein 5 n=1 Tax=Petunia hybrida TaxID=4102 RepID=Q8LRM0_PETHY|nr:nam-like protein 5 [Petunia x hybrida]
MEEKKEGAKTGTVGNLNLPIGFRFHPTDEELFVHYLSKKIFSMPLPALIIPEHHDVFHTFPCDLPAGDLREKRYFFSKTNGQINSKGCSILISGRDYSGYWNAIGQGQLIVVPFPHQQQGLVLGMKKAFRFYQTNQIKSLRTRWVMHQYSLVSTSQNVNNMMQVGDWSIFSIYQRKLKSKNVIRAKANALAEQCNKTNTRKRPLSAMLLQEKEFH